VNAQTDLKAYDVAVVGMGPAGATAAYELSRAGLSVIGFDKEVHPRYKVCGGGLSARIDQILDAEFHDVVEQTIRGVQFTYQGKRPLTIQADSPIAYMVMRSRFDHLLVQKAAQVGTLVHAGEPVVDCLAREDAIELSTARGRYWAKIVIGADGATSRVAQRLFPRRRARCIPALESEIPIDLNSSYPETGHIVVDVGATSRGYAWIFPKQDRLSVGIGDFQGRASSLKQMFQQFVANAPPLSSFTIPSALGHPIPLYVAPSVTSTTHRLVHGRALLIGDAAHLVDPLFGEGIYYAIRSGQMAAAAILDQRTDTRRSLHDYELAVGREIYPEFNVAARLAQIIYTFPRLCHRLLFHYEDVIGLYYDVLRGRQTYQTFYGHAKGLIKGSIKDLLRNALRAK
jgi:geranylgeranyl reductase family protein